MRAILGIDAAWTTKNPSGVALAVETKSGWTIKAVEASYQRFLALAINGVGPEARPSGSLPNAQALLNAAHRIAGLDVSLVAVDMPLSRTPITRRRESDDAVSRAYGGRKCGTHSPSSERPGPISDQLREGFKRAGFQLLTSTISCPGLIEVYPHPALVELARASERLKYKVAKARAFWPEVPPAERKALLFQEWTRIIDLLESKVSGVAAALSGFEQRTQGYEMQATENALDAVVCVWVAVCALSGDAIPFGDQDSAIWIPRPMGG